MPNESFEVSVFLNEETELTFVNKQESFSEVIEVIDVDQSNMIDFEPKSFMQGIASKPKIKLIGDSIEYF